MINGLCLKCQIREFVGSDLRRPRLRPNGSPLWPEWSSLREVTNLNAHGDPTGI